MKQVWLISLLLVSSAAFPAEYEIDPAHSSVLFTIKHLMVSNLKGSFNQVSGKIVYDPDDLTASHLEAEVDAASLSTRDAKRDAQLKSADFLNVEKYPAITFKSKRMERSPGNLFITGDLTIRDITKEIVLTVDGPTTEAKDADENFRSRASATTRINRKNWNLNWNALKQAGGVVVADEVAITLGIEAVRKPIAARNQ